MSTFVTYKTYIGRNGYRIFKDTNIFLHRYIAEKKLGRKLYPREVVHHINRRKTDNRPSNLWIFKNQKQHDFIHKKDAYRYGRKVSYIGF